MKEEKKEKSAEKDSAITILDKGIISANDPGPQIACCFAAFFPFRG